MAEVRNSVSAGVVSSSASYRKKRVYWCRTGSSKYVKLQPVSSLLSAKVPCASLLDNLSLTQLAHPLRRVYAVLVGINSISINIDSFHSVKPRAGRVTRQLERIRSFQAAGLAETLGVQFSRGPKWA